MLLNPVVAARSCEQCAEWWYDDGYDKGQTGTWVFRDKILPDGRGNNIKRSPQAKTPCEHCPKKSPEYAKTLELSDRNAQMVQFYFQTVACSGANLTKRMKADELLMKNLTAIDRLFKRHERT